tara:strand:- start:5390 stop:6628 length:1239 start_codon:yes stop_codon:yes gene_type:complete
MQIFKNNFFWYVFSLTTFIVSIYFFTFSGRLNHHKFVQDRLSGDILLKTYYDYENLKQSLDLYENFFKGNLLDKDRYQNNIDNIFAKIVRFTQTNKNYKYEYRDYKKLNKKEFKELEKILNNISLEGAYYLLPKHLDKVTINLFTSKSTQKEKFLNYYRFIIDREIEKHTKYVATLGNNFLEDQAYQDLISEVNLIRDLNYGFLLYIYDKITLAPLVTKPLSSLNFNVREIEYLLEYLQCSFYDISTKFSNFCKIIDEQAIEKIISIYEELASIKIHKLENVQRGPSLIVKGITIQSRSLFDKLIVEWTIKDGYNNKSYYKILSKAFSVDYLRKVQQASELTQKYGILNNNFNYRFLNSKNYNLEKLKEEIFSNLKEVETKKNYFELLSFIIFALIFSFTANIIYRSFLDKK